MNFAEVRVGDVRVYLRCIDRSVSEELLDGANVRAVTQKIGREEVTEGVRRDDICDASSCDIRFQVSLHIARDDAMQFVRSAIYEQRFFHIVSRFEVFAHGLLRDRGEEYDTHLLALPAHGNFVAR